ncbi:hypothetical protein CIB48_g5684 [Xylaria polymorpha]|nr:hypothetical protein CIB48_g5684 [Xylaria polymorpha]
MSQTFSTVFAEPTFALASHFPELDPVAILQLVEAPVVSLAFYEFRSRFWDACRNISPTEIHIQLVEKALDDFSKNPAGSRITNIGGGFCSNPDDYQIEDSIYAFMSRVYGWATQNFLDLPIRRQLENPNIGASLLWGILGICISLHENGQFPEPLLPLPTEEFEFKHVEGDLDVNDVENWKNATRAMRYEPRSYFLWQEWRLRHEALNDQRVRANFTVSWAAKISEDYCSGPYAPARDAYDWLQIVRVARVYNEMEGPSAVLTKHCIFRF